MVNTWFTADFHLGHRNIIRYCQRPFQTVAEMDEAILDRLNASAKERDVLYYLGDFCLASGKRAAEYRRRIRCQNIYFVEGNHDAGARKILSEFRWCKQLAEIQIGKQAIVLCHYARRVWRHWSRGAWHLYGHSHGKLDPGPASLSMDVGVDTHDFRPWHFDEIKARMEEKRLAAREHGNTGKEAHDELL
jgi:calcineurin-like phosphoesterase family protein